MSDSTCLSLDFHLLFLSERFESRVDMEVNHVGDTPHMAEKEKAIPGENEKELVNSSGHVQEMDRTFSVTSLCLMAVLADNVSVVLTSLSQLST